MSQFYYLLSSMPTLTPDSQLPMSPAAFLDYAAEWATKDEVSIIGATTIAGTSGSVRNEFLDTWNAFVFDARNELARARAAKLGFEQARWVRKNAEGLSAELYGLAAEAILAAVHTADPIEGEKVLAQLFWDQLESQIFGHQFELQAVQAYYLKLQILERFSAFTLSAGEARFAGQYETVSRRIAEADQNPDSSMENV